MKLSPDLAYLGSIAEMLGAIRQLAPSAAEKTSRPEHSEAPNQNRSIDSAHISNASAPSLDLPDTYRILVEQIPAIVFMAHLGSGVSKAYVSAQIEEKLGYSQQEWLDDPLRWYQRIHPDDRERWSLEAADTLIMGKPLRSIYRVLARDGRSVWFQCEAKMVRDEQGQPWFIHGVGFDITGLKLTEHALAERASQLETLNRATQRINAILEEPSIMYELLSSAMTLTQAQGGMWGRVIDEQLIYAEHLRKTKRTPLNLAVLCSPQLSHPTICNDNLSAQPGDDLVSTLRHTLGIRSFAFAPIIGRGGDLLGCLEVHDKFRGVPFDQSDMNLVQVLASDAAVALENARIIKEQRLAEESLRKLSTELLHLQDQERRNIARDLHDSTAQTLCGLTMTLEALKVKLDSPGDEIQRRIDQAISLADQAANEVRDLSHLLHPPALDEVGLASAAEWYITQFTQQSGIAVEKNIREDMPRLPTEVEMTLFRVIQEGLANVRKHSKSESVRIEIICNNDRATLVISDQGQGLPPDLLKKMANEPGSFGIGIQGMRERLRHLGGDLSLASNGHGTTLKADIPLNVTRS